MFVAMAEALQTTLQTTATTALVSSLGLCFVSRCGSSAAASDSPLRVHAAVGAGIHTVAADARTAAC